MTQIRQSWLDQIKAVEVARRAKQYDEMDRLAQGFDLEIEDDDSFEACSARSKLYYELSMGERQQYEASNTPKARAYHLAEGLKLAEQSRDQAVLAHDELDALFNEVNIGGFFMREQGRKDEALVFLVGVSVRAKLGAEHPATSDADRDRYLRCMMNADRFRARIYYWDIDPSLIRVEVMQDLRERMRNNPLFATTMADSEADVDLVDRWLAKHAGKTAS